MRPSPPGGPKRLPGLLALGLLVGVAPPPGQSAPPSPPGAGAGSPAARHPVGPAHRFSHPGDPARRTRAQRRGVARPGTSWDDPVRSPRDLTGRSVKTPRVRAVHSRDPGLRGATADLFERDPWLAYQRGRELTLREFSHRDGVFGAAGELAGATLEDGATHMASRGHASSCAMCHNTPWRDMGSGAVIAKNSGRGRDTPHLFGAGLLEMLGWQGRQRLLDQVDRDGNGWVSRKEARGRAALLPTPGGRPVALGSFADGDGDGRPDLDPVLAVWYVDSRGQRMTWARRLTDPGVAGYCFEFQTFGFGHHPRQSEHGPPVPSTLRAFAAAAFDQHAGLQAFDPTLQEDPESDGLSQVSLAGAPQFTSAVARDRGSVRSPQGVSLEDPDRDGVVEEISQGDLDLVEFFLLHHPAPAQRATTPRTRWGRRLLERTGCTRCHVADWEIEAAPSPAPDPAREPLGDRRRFHLEVAPHPTTGELQGRLADLTRERAGRREPLRGAFRVVGLYSDLASHDLGAGFHEVQFDGSVIRRHRTTPLWGVGSTAPYGHDGASLDLDAVIRRHGGEARAATEAYRELPDLAREALLAFLRSLVLYSTEDLPCDLDGDGHIAEHFRVQGQDTGREGFRPEWLLATPGRIEGPVRAPDGSRITSFALTNLRQAYGLDLEWLRDRDGDGFPDRRGPLLPPERKPAP